MNPPTYAEENKKFIKQLFGGKMTTVLHVCHACDNIYLTERGPSPEFAPDCCPFCETPRSMGTSATTMFAEKNIKDVVKELSEKLETKPETLELATKIKRVILESEKQRYNVGACTECNNRFIFLEEDADAVMCCPFCDADYSEMEALLDYDTGSLDTVNEMQSGLGNYVNRLFFLRTTDGIEDNFILTDVDTKFLRLRFVSPVDDCMAFWISEREIVNLLEFVKLTDFPALSENPEQ